MITTLSQFLIGEYRIEGLVLSSNTNMAQKSIADNVQYYIDKYEPMYLNDLLGNKLAKEFELYVSSKGEGELAFDFLKEVFVSGESPIVMYIYYYYTKRETSISVVSMTADDNIKDIVALSGRLMVSAWNDMVRINKAIISQFPFPTDKNILAPINDMNL